MTVRLTGRRGLPRLDRRRLRGRAQRVLRALDLGASELSLSLLDDEAMARLNERYRGKRGPTDVLSFSLMEGAYNELRGGMLGDVIVSLDTAARQAKRGRRSLDEEVLRLVIHGTLHLLGHDHQEDAEARRMRAEERRVWREVSG